MSVNHQADHHRDNAIEQHENPASVLSNLLRAEDYENAFDDQIHGEDKRDEI